MKWLLLLAGVVLLLDNLRLRRALREHGQCHNLDGSVGPDQFADGCAAYQRELFGCAPHADAVKLLVGETPPPKRKRTMWG